MLYYLGKGKEFKKEECKEYKTLKNALAAAGKDEALTVWDETGKSVGGLTDNVPEGALNTNPDGSVPVFDEKDHIAGTVDASTATALTGEGEKTAEEEQNKTAAEMNTQEAKTGENGADRASQEDTTIIPHGKMKVTVICEGTLNLRRSAEWGNANICGRAARGQSYYVKAIHTVQGKRMVQTVDNIYLSGQSKHVQFEQL